MTKSLAEQIAELSPEEREKVLEDIDPEELLYDWKFWGRPEQQLPETDDWGILLALAGRGWGKTRASAEAVREWAKTPNMRIGLVARTAADVRDVIVEGEALALDTPVPTPTGWTTMGALEVGDQIYASDGSICSVTEAFPVLNNRPCYKVQIEDECIIADANHKWVTSTHRDRHNFSRSRRSKPAHESVCSTFDIYNDVKTSKKWSVSQHAITVTGIIGDTTELPIDPYTLGYWLGDGSSRSAYITSHPDDQVFVRSYIESAGYQTQLSLGQDPQGYTFLVKRLSRDLRSSNLLNNKHIPAEYMRASKQQRLELLQGLMDSDGYVSNRGQFEFSNKNTQIAEGVFELLASLGVKSRITLKGRQWRVRGRASECIFRLPRKLERVPTKSARDLWRYITNVSETDSVPVRCIAVDSSDRTFLVGKTFVRTHNSGVLNVCPPSERPDYKPSIRRLIWPNGSTATLHTADEPDSLRGPQYHYAFADEFAAWRQIPDSVGMTAWSNLRIATRLPGPKGGPKIFVATTPKKTQTLKDLLKEAETDPRIVVRRGSTRDNRGNLDESYLAAIEGVYGGTRLARQELEGEMMDDVEGALWSEQLIDDFRSNTVPIGTPLRVVGVDPTVADRPGDECGIIVASATGERDLYKRQSWILEDSTIKGSPDEWANRVVATARKWSAPVVAEKNQGGALIRNAIHQIDPNIPVFEVWSKQGKALRAEPVSLAYEQGRVHHLGFFAELESQMISWEPGASKSPDRIDALVLALTALLVTPPKGFGGGILTAKSVAQRKLPSMRSTTPSSGRRGAIFGAGIRRR